MTAGDVSLECVGISGRFGRRDICVGSKEISRIAHQPGYPMLVSPLEDMQGYSLLLAPENESDACRSINMNLPSDLYEAVIIIGPICQSEHTRSGSHRPVINAAAPIPSHDLATARAVTRRRFQIFLQGDQSALRQMVPAIGERLDVPG